MSDCLILGADAEQLAEEVARLSGNSLDLTVCTSHQQALETYSNQSIAFGNPEMIARVLPEMPSIRWVQSSWAGIKPLIENTRRDYVLTSAKGVFGPQIRSTCLATCLHTRLR